MSYKWKFLIVLLILERNCDLCDKKRRKHICFSYAEELYGPENGC